MADSPASPSSSAGPPHSEPGDDHDSSCLPIGTRLGEFELTGLIGVGGFGIVYSARDHLLEREVAIKEYMPSALASRTADYRVTVKSERHHDTFAVGLRSFVNEAKLLAQFDHPSLVKVYRFWEANGTAYMVMPYYRGTTLRAALKSLGEAPDETAVLQLLRPMLDALDVIHAERCYHRDIAPDNILILQSGRPVLLDFGAARRVIGDFTQALTVILKPGFAPVEQYANGPEMRQGPWTDIYALAAVVYYCIGGKTPTPSVSRMMRDTMVPARELGKGRYSESFLAAIDHALAVHIEDRIASVAQLRTELGLEEIVEKSSRTRLGPGPAPGPSALAPATAPPLAQGQSAAPSIEHPSDSDEMTLPVAAGLPTDFGEPIAPPARASAPPAVAMPSALAAPMPAPAPSGTDPLGIYQDAAPARPAAAPGAYTTGAQGPPSTPPPRVAPSPAPAVSSGTASAGSVSNAPPSRRNGLMVAAIAGVLVLGAGGAWLMFGGSPPPAPNPTPQVAPPTMIASTPGGTAAAPTPSAAPTAAPPATAPEPPAASPPPAAATPAFSPRAVVESLYELRDPAWPVTVKLRSDTLRIDRDNLQFRVTSARAGHLYVIQVGTDSAHFWQLFPNGSDRANRIEANRELVLPRASWSVLSSGPAGMNRLIAIVTPSPRDFSAAGLQPTTSSSFIGEFDLAQARSAWTREGPSAFAGKAINCPLDAAACARFGAARFDIREVN
ncbi:MAG: protein kinase [Burkholderiaceae bacterium]|nr:protein kinase [Burkholderiaceae bacterium]